MSDRTLVEQQPDPGFDGTFEGTRRRQFRIGLELDYAGRLRWLEAKMSELRELQGKANVGTDRPARIMPPATVIA